MKNTTDASFSVGKIWYFRQGEVIEDAFHFVMTKKVMSVNHLCRGIGNYSIRDMSFPFYSCCIFIDLPNEIN